jgi:hypothetical protein
VYYNGKITIYVLELIIKTVSLAVAFLVIYCTSVFADDRYLFEQNFAVNNVTAVIYEEWGNTYSYIPNIGFSAGKRVIYNGTIQLLDYVIPDSALAVLNNDELWVLKNTIYARHGMIFQSSDLTAYFRQFSWYNPRFSNVEGRLSEIDWANIENIEVFEFAQSNQNLRKSDIVGWGVEYFPVPSWTPEISIYDNNIIEWSRGGEDYFRGSYRIENGFLVVYVTEQYVGTVDYFLNYNWRWPNGVSYRDGIVTYSEPIRMVFPVGDPYVFDYSGYINQSRQIGSVRWFGIGEWVDVDNLSRSMQMRAIELARARHYNSNFEGISLVNSYSEMNGNFFYMVNTYKVVMRGAILGIITNTVEVTVTGRIDVRNNTIQVLEANIR